MKNNFDKKFAVEWNYKRWVETLGGEEFEDEFETIVRIKGEDIFAEIDNEDLRWE